MHFIFLGIIILLVQLPLDWTAGYLLKTAGFALSVMGLADMRLLCSSQDRSDNDTPPVRISGLGGIAVWKTVDSELTKAAPDDTICPVRTGVLKMLGRNAAAGAAVSLACAVTAALFEFLLKDVKTAANITAAVSGTLCTLLALRSGCAAVAFMDSHERIMSHSTGAFRKLMFTDNRTDILRMKSVFGKTAICILVNLACDVLNRLVPIESVQTYAGFLGIISKLTAYAFVIAAAVKANAVRRGIMRKNGSLLGDTNDQ